MTKLSDLPAQERAARYREMAAEAERMGRAGDDSIGDAYLTIAQQWRKMADGIEAALHCADQ